MEEPTEPATTTPRQQTTPGDLNDLANDHAVNQDQEVAAGATETQTAAEETAISAVLESDQMRRGEDLPERGLNPLADRSPNRAGVWFCRGLQTIDEAQCLLILSNHSCLVLFRQTLSNGIS